MMDVLDTVVGACPAGYEHYRYLLAGMLCFVFVEGVLDLFHAIGAGVSSLLSSRR